MTDADRIRHLEACNATQAKTIEGLWVENTKKARRIETQQGMIDYLRNWKERHEQSNTPKARAQALFEKG